MKCLIASLFAMGVLIAAPLSAAEITGKYVEARTCDVWSAPCFANAEMNLSGKHAVMAWKIDKGQSVDVSLDGLSIVAVIVASDTLGLQQTAATKAMLIVDEKATPKQQAALMELAKKQGGDLLKNVVAVRAAPIQMTICDCDGGACAKLEAGKLAKIETRCIKGDHDKACGNEGNFYPPLVRNVKAQAAVAVEHSFKGDVFNATWMDADRRGAYVGSFSVR